MNKRNYNKEMQDEISSIGCRKPSMLLQCCCAPCATAVINRLKDFDVTLFYYNPNTFPESEYQKRFEYVSPPLSPCEQHTLCHSEELHSNDVRIPRKGTIL